MHCTDVRVGNYLVNYALLPEELHILVEHVAMMLLVQCKGGTSLIGFIHRFVVGTPSVIASCIRSTIRKSCATECSMNGSVYAL